MSKEFMYQIRVFAEDTDYGGIVYHSKYLNFFERARTEWLFSEGFKLEVLAKEQILFVIKHVDLDYVKPIQLSDLINVTATISKFGRTSLMFEQTIHHPDDKTYVYARANILVVCVNVNMKPIRISNPLREALS